MADIKKYLDQVAAQELVTKIKAADAATLQSAKDYADGLADNYEVAGAAATAEANAKAHADAEIAKVNEEVAKKATTEDLNAEVAKAREEEGKLAGLIDGVSTKANANETAIAAINNETTGILATAKGYTDTEVAKVQGEVDALETFVGTIPETATATDVIGYINEKTSGIATDAALSELQGKVTAAEEAIDAIEKDYLKAADKTELSNAIVAEKTRAEGIESGLRTDVDAIKGDYLKASDKTELQGNIDGVSAVANAAATKVALEEEVTRAKGEEARIEGLVTAEVAKAREEEGKLDARLVKVETFFEKAEDETINDALDTLVEIQAYITGEGAAADEMVKDIAANAKAIEDMDAAYKLADQTLQGNIDSLSDVVDTKAAQDDLDALDERVETAEGKITTAEGKITTLEGQMTAVQGAVATKAEAQALTDAVAALEGADSDLDERLQAVETQLGDGEGSVADQIADAKQAAIDAAAADATSKANAAETAAKEHANGLNTAMNARVEALEAVDHEHDNKDLLDTYTQTEANLADAVAKKHAHGNMDVLEGITAEKVTAWDAAETNAKAHADSLNTAMTGKVEALEAKVTQNTTDIATKAAKDDLNKAVERIAKNETDIAANAALIAAFQPITVGEIDAMFA